MRCWIAFVFFLCTNAIAAPQVVDKIAAIVDRDIILESDVNNMMKMVKLSAKDADKKLLDNTTLRRKILDRLIMDNIILQRAEHANITVSEDQLDQAISNIAAQNHMTLNQLRNRMACDKKDYDTYRAQVSKDMLIAAVRNSEVSRRVNILSQEVDSLAKQVALTNNGAEFNISHIMIPLPEKPSPEQLDKAESLANLLIEQSKKNLEEFDQLAITYHTDSHTLTGDKICWSTLEELPSLFADRLHGARKGSIIGPIRSDIGFHIIKVNDIRGDNQKIVVTEVHTRHIFLRSSLIITDQQAQAKLEAIAQHIKNGRISFSDVAKQLSEDSSSSHQGGDLGWSALDTFDPALRDVLIHLNKGEISDPVHSAYGWHLIQLINIRHVDYTEAAQKNHAYRLIFNRKFAEAEQTWMQEQRASAYVKILDNDE